MSRADVHDACKQGHNQELLQILTSIVISFSTNHGTLPVPADGNFVSSNSIELANATLTIFNDDPSPINVTVDTSMKMVGTFPVSKSTEPASSATATVGAALALG